MSKRQKNEVAAGEIGLVALACASRLAAALLAGRAESAEAAVRLTLEIRDRLLREAHVAAVGRLPAVPIEDSVQDGHLVCLEDGKKLKLLKRYLKTHYGLSPEAYRERWGLPPDYPMAAPSYARDRALVARRLGLGRRS